MIEPLPLSFDEQLSLLKERGMLVKSEDVEKLKVIGLSVRNPIWLRHCSEH